MKIKSAIPQLIVIILLISCAEKKQISATNVPDGKLIIVGLVEYNYSQLKNKRIKGIDVYLDAKTKAKNFSLSSKLLPKEDNKYYKFISKIGSIGEYELVYQHSTSSGEIDNLISLMEMDKNSNTRSKTPIQKFIFNDCKIIDIGKIIVNYKGGDIIDGIINYSYTFSYTDDTTALHALKESNPSIFATFKNEICSFRGDFEQNIDFVLNHISEGKKIVIRQFFDNHPDKIKIIFKDLNSENKEKFVTQIEQFSFDELNEFLNGGNNIK